MGFFASALGGLAAGLLGGESSRKSASKARRANAKIIAKLDKMLEEMGIKTEADFKAMLGLAGEDRDLTDKGFKRAESTLAQYTLAAQNQLANRNTQLQAQLGANMRRSNMHGSTMRNSLARGINADTNRGFQEIFSGQARTHTDLITRGTGARSNALRNIINLMGQASAAQRDISGQRVDAASGAFRSVSPPAAPSAYAPLGQAFGGLFSQLDLSSLFGNSNSGSNLQLPPSPVSNLQLPSSTG
jgi:hypothetical protein